MTSISLSSHKLDSELLCPTSKSYANRSLILAAIDKRPILIKDLPHSEDVEFMIDGLAGLGINVLKKNNDVEIIGCIDDVKSGCSVYLGEGGTTIRFFMALVSLLSVPVKLKVHPRFLKRPINEYIKLLNSLAVKVELGEDFILVQGPIFKGQKIEVDCSKSTQFASALELISEKANLDVSAVNLVASGGYFKMTKKVLEDLSESTTYHVPVDYSSFGYFAAFAALTTPVTVTNAHVIDPLQGDSQILEFIKRMGGDFKLTSKGVVI
ncbi:MAG: hypothetical protein KC478_15315, partial [Bacteriovoracaceae bacterium]|nr:hypothetical protein [Bacteriovoracaceae bacterium]